MKVKQLEWLQPICRKLNREHEGCKNKEEIENRWEAGEITVLLNVFIRFQTTAWWAFQWQHIQVMSKCDSDFHQKILVETI